MMNVARTFLILWLAAAFTSHAQTTTPTDNIQVTFSGIFDSDPAVILGDDLSYSGTIVYSRSAEIILEEVRDNPSFASTRYAIQSFTFSLGGQTVSLPVANGFGGLSITDSQSFVSDNISFNTDFESGPIDILGLSATSVQASLQAAGLNTAFSEITLEDVPETYLAGGLFNNLFRLQFVANGNSFSYEDDDEIGVNSTVVSFTPADTGAGVLFDNFGADNEFDISAGRTIQPPDSGDFNPPAYSFFAAATGELTAIDLALSSFVIGTGDISLEVMLRETEPCTGMFDGREVNCFGGNLPGNVLGTWSISGPLASEVVRIDTPSSGITLIQNEEYFLQIVAANSRTRGIWWNNSTGHTGDLFQCGGAVNGVDCSRFTAFANVTTGAMRLLSNPPQGEAPVADAGPDQSARAGDAVILDGTSSFDDDTATSELTPNWRIISAPLGSTTSLTNANTLTPSLFIDISGTYEVELIVTDAGGLVSAPDTVVISAVNLAPTADAGPDQLTYLNSTVVLDGSGSFDPEGDPITYDWLVTSPSGTELSLTGAQPSFTVVEEGDYSTVLTVSDSFGPGPADTAVVTVAAADQFAQIALLQANDFVTTVDATEVTTAGNQNALTNFFAQAIRSIQKGNIADAITKLENALSRTDGCAERGVPDEGGNENERDWIVSCGAQATVYSEISSALAALRAL